MRDPYEQPDPWQADDAASPPPLAANPIPPSPDEATLPGPIAYGVDLPGSPAAQPSPNQLEVSKLRAGIAWTVIVVCVAVLIALQLRGMQEIQNHAAEDPRPSIDVLYAARYHVGMQQLWPESAQLMPAQPNPATDDSPHILQNQIRSVILAAEIGSDPQWQDRLTVLEQLGADYPAGNDEVAADAQLTARILRDGYTPTPQEQAGLVQRHGWFGELGGTYNLPKDTEAYQAPRNSSMRMVIGILGMIAAILLAGVTGLALLPLLIVLWATKKLTLKGPRGPAADRTAYLEAFALFLILLIGLSVVLGVLQALAETSPNLPQVPIQIGSTLVLLLGVIPALFWPLMVGVRWSDFKTDMGYHTGAGLFKELGLGAVGYIAGLPIIAAGIGLSALLSAITSTAADHPIQYEILEGGPYMLWLTLGSAVVWAPLVEESAFRAGLYRHLRQRRGLWGWAAAVLVTSFLFAAIHPQGIAGVPALMSIAIVFAMLREWRGTIVPSMVGHALHNGAAVLFMCIALFA